MSALRIIIAALTVACAPPPCVSEGIVHRGEPDPGYVDVLASANPCDWTGVVEWVDGPFNCDGILAAGCYWYFECPQRIEVMRFGDAARSALGHELEHACGVLPFERLEVSP